METGELNMMNLFRTPKTVRSFSSLVTRHSSLLYAAIFLVTCHLSLVTAFAQRDYFTPEEVEMIRDAQQIDQRVDLLVKIIDRRFAALNIEVGGAKFSATDSDE